jgi:acetylornithine deacetylase
VNDTELRVLDAIDQDSLLAALAELVAVQSLDGTPEELRAQEVAAAIMGRCGLAVERWGIDLAALREHPAFCWEVERERAMGVVGALGEGHGGRSLIFNGHVDVVPAGDPANWRYPPWQATLADGRVYGRGSVDMKAGVCCAIFAAKAIADAGVRLRGRLLVQTVMGEEASARWRRCWRATRPTPPWWWSPPSCGWRRCRRAPTTSASPCMACPPTAACARRA